MAGANEQSNNIGVRSRKPARDKVTAKYATELYAEQAERDGVAKALARSRFRDQLEDDVAPYLTKRGVDHVFDKVFGDGFDTKVEDEAEKIKVREAARAVVDAERTTLTDDLVLTVDDLMTMPDPEWLVDGLLPAVGTFQLFGASNTGKSFVALDLLLCVAQGDEDWLGHFPVSRQGTALYVAAEGMFDLKLRVAGWQMHRNEGFKPRNLQAIGDAGLDLRLTPHVDWVIDQAKRMGAVAVIFDTWALHMPGGDENSAKDVGQVVAGLKRMATELQALVGTVHHTGKNEEMGARGSSAMRAAWDVELEFTGTLLKHTKARYGEKHQPIGVAMDRVEVESSDGEVRTTLVPRRVEATTAAASAGLGKERQLLDAVVANEGANWTALREKLGGNGNRWAEVRDGLIEASRLQKAKKGFVVVEVDEATGEVLGSGGDRG